jgi:hypothetical protein
VVTLAGIAILVIPEPLNTFAPVVLSREPAPKVTDVKEVAPENTLLPILVTLSGIAILVIAEPANTLSLIMFSREPAPKVTDNKEPVLENAEFPIVVTLSGIATLAIAEELNALAPILVTVYDVLLTVMTPGMTRLGLNVPLLPVTLAMPPPYEYVTPSIVTLICILLS